MSEATSTKQDDDYAAAMAESARADAEARRRRILEKSNQRLGIVSGEVPKAAMTALVEEVATPAAAAAAASTETGDETETTTTTGASSSSSSGKSASSAARMQAMRKRRFKKTEATAKDGDDVVSAAAPSETTTSEMTTTTSTTATATTTTDDAPKAEETTDTTTPDVVESITENESTSTAAAADITASGSEDADGTKKKYLGVAKMRRQMIKKKQEQEQQQGYSTTTTTTTSNTSSKSTVPSATTTTTSSSSSSKNPKLRKLSTAAVKVPVLLHFLTLLLLFGAGLQVGLQQGLYWSSHEAAVVAVDDTPVMIQNQWGPRHRGLLSWLDANNSTTTAKINSIRRDIGVDDAANNQNTKSQKQPSQTDHTPKSSEFEEHILSMTDDDTERTIDPIFRIDLDKVTQGPGLLMQLARGAVAVHRMLVTILWLWPQRFLISMWRLPYNLWTTPPILCGLALFIRQVIAKLVLGDVKLPHQQHQAYEPKNLVAMVLQTGISFLSKTFPTLARVYEGWNHLRSDLYIVMCGLFVGLAWIYSGTPAGRGTSRLVTRDDEL